MKDIIYIQTDNMYHVVTGQGQEEIGTGRQYSFFRDQFGKFLACIFWGTVIISLLAKQLVTPFITMWGTYYSYRSMNRAVAIAALAIYIIFTTIDLFCDSESENYLSNTMVSFGLVFSIFLSQRIPLAFLVIFSATVISAAVSFVVIKMAIPKDRWRPQHSTTVLRCVRNILLAGSLLMVAIYFFALLYGVPRPVPHSQGESPTANSEETAASNPLEGYQENLHPRVWQTLSLDEKLDTLQMVEYYEAMQTGRPVAQVKAKRFSDNNMYGCYYIGRGVIAISREHLETGDVEKVMNTLLHEGRHAQQDYLVSYFTEMGWCSEEIIQSNSYFEDIRDWKNSYEKLGQEEYYYSSLEVDARSYAFTRLMHAPEYQIVHAE